MWSTPRAPDAPPVAARPYPHRVTDPPSSRSRTDRPVATRFEVVRVLAPAQLDAVTDLVGAATDADGLHPLSEHVVLHLPLITPSGDQHVLAWAPPEAANHQERLAGYAHLDPTDVVDGASGELVVHPVLRRRGVGRQLVEHLRAQAPDDRLRLWAHGEQPGAQALAASLGYVTTRQLWQMRRSLRSRLPEVTVPEGYTLRTFVPGQDDEAWVALNAAAFADHPEQGGWTLADLRHRMAEDWFDPAGFFLLEAHGEAGGGLAGFHWTKLHTHDTSGGTAQDTSDPASTDAGSGDAGSGHEPIGEVYVVGVAPGHRGRHLGSVLTVLGLRHLRSQGLAQAMLYVDADNTAAVHTYQGLGFTRWDVDAQYSAGRGDTGR
jgi:mycothiol synthase